MRCISIFIFSLWSTISFATGQRGELIIYKGDTLTMLTEPLEVYLRNNEPRRDLHSTLENGCSTALWRGYVGLWKIEDGRLLLLDIYLCGYKSHSIKDIIFKNHNGKLFADWFTGDLLIEKGEMIKYNHSGYDRYFEMEIVANVRDGNIQSEKEYRNGIKPDDKRFSRDIDKINKEIYNKINWKKLPKLSNDKRLFVELTLDNGRLLTTDSIIDKQNIEDIYKMEIKRIIADFPEVQVFYSRGQPLKEGYYGAIIFSRQNKRRYAR